MPSTRPTPPRDAIAKDCRRLRNDVTSTADEGRAVHTLTEISVDKEDRSFISDLGRGDVELCVEILDRVNRGLHVVQGVRPTKPENASASGVSDSLWHSVQRCWHGDMKLRPEVGKVVTPLERVVTDLDGVMPPFVASKELVSDPMEHCEFEIRFSLDITH